MIAVSGFGSWMVATAMAAPSAPCVAIVGATVELPAGPTAGPTVVVQNGKIAAVADKLADLVITGDAAKYRGADCAVLAADGAPLTAGLVAVPTHIGLVEVELERGSRDDDPQTDDPIRASQVVVDGYDPLSVVVPVTRIHGITSAVTLPTGGFVSGMAGFVRMRGATQAESVIDRDAAMVMSVPTGAFADGARELRELVADVRTHARSPSLYDQGRPYIAGASRLDLEALRPVVEGKLPVLIGVDAASDLEAMVRLKAELGIDFVLVGASEGWLVADQLAAAKIPVIVDPMVYGPGGFDQIHARPDNAARLAAAGVPLILMTSFDTHNARTLRQAAGNAVREGLPHDDAIRAITSTPARVFGQPDRGRIAVGAAADLVLWSGDPLELSSRVVREWIDGVEVTLTSRQTALLDKYRTLPGSPPPPLSVP